MFHWNGESLQPNFVILFEKGYSLQYRFFACILRSKSSPTGESSSGSKSYLGHFSVHAQKIRWKNKKRSTLKKVIIFFRKKLFLYFRKWNFLTPRLKISHILPKKFFLYFGKWNFFSTSLKNLHFLSELEKHKNPLWNNFPYFSKILL